MEQVTTRYHLEVLIPALSGSLLWHEQPKDTLSNSSSKVRVLGWACFIMMIGTLLMGSDLSRHYSFAPTTTVLVLVMTSMRPAEQPCAFV